jgi:hypothetical protein
MLGRDDIIHDHARAYWHEAGHVLIARKLDVPVAGVIYTNLKRRPDMRVSGTLATAYYFTRETNPVRKAAEQAEWVRYFGIDKVCTATAGGTAAEEIYSAPAELALEDGELIKSRTNGTRTIQDFLPQATQILTANAETLKTLAARLIENGRRVLDKVGLNSVMPSQWELVITREEIISICG